MAGDVPLVKYDKIWLSNFFHGFPHVNFKFIAVNSTFDPESDDYKEAAAFWGLVPVAACLLLWLVFLVYFIFRCCQSGARAKPRPSACPGVITGILILITIGLLGFGLHQNEEAHRGVEDGRRSLSEANTTITLATARVHALDTIAKSVSTNIADDLENALNSLNSTVMKKAMAKLDRIRKEAASVNGFIDQINIKDEEGSLDDAINISGDVEYYRWTINIVIYVVFLFLVLLSFIGILVKSKVILIISATSEVIFSILMWSATGIYLSGSMVMGDVCVDPDSYFLSLAKGSSSEAAVRAYILCTDPTAPYQTNIQAALNAVSLAGKDLNDTVKLAKPFYTPQIDGPVGEMTAMLRYATGNLSTLLTNVGMCSTLHYDYVQSLNAICIHSLSATAFLAVISCVVAVVCTLIIFSLSCAWRQYSKASARSAYVPVDDSDPFLPRPPQYEPDYGTMNHSTSRPWSERGTLQHSTNINADENLRMMRHQSPPPLDDSPPPAYHPGQYIRQYADTAPSPGCVGQQPYN